MTTLSKATPRQPGSVALVSMHGAPLYVHALRKGVGAPGVAVKVQGSKESNLPWQLLPLQWRSGIMKGTSWLALTLSTSRWAVTSLCTGSVPNVL